MQSFCNFFSYKGVQELHILSFIHYSKGEEKQYTAHKMVLEVEAESYNTCMVQRLETISQIDFIRRFLRTELLRDEVPATRMHKNKFIFQTAKSE